MSSQQISTEPTAPHCPICGAEVRDLRRRYCWLCGEDLVQHGVTAQRPRAMPSFRRPAEARGDAPVLAVFGVLALLLGVALLTAGPGALVLLFILATPALIRTVVATVRRDKEGAPAEGLAVLGTFLSSIGVVALVGVASVAAFYATCAAVCFGGFALTGDKGGSGDLIIIASIAAGLVPGIAVAVFLFRALWRRKAS